MKKIAPCSTKVAQSSTEVAQYSAKVGNKKISSKHIHAGSSFEDLVAMNPTVKTDLNSDVWFKRYDFLKIEVAKINVRESVSRTSPYAFNANKKHSLADKKRHTVVAALCYCIPCEE